MHNATRIVKELMSHLLLYKFVTGALNSTQPLKEVILTLQAFAKGVLNRRSVIFFNPAAKIFTKYTLKYGGTYTSAAKDKVKQLQTLLPYKFIDFEYSLTC